MSTSMRGPDVTEAGAFLPVHRVPDAALPWWSEPDPERDSEGTLDPRLPVQVLETTTGWARVRCENEFECWVDAARLIEVPAAAPADTTASEATKTTELPEATEQVDATEPSDATEPVPATAAVESELLEQPDAAAAPRAAPMGKAARISITLSIVGAALAIVGSFLPWYSAGGADVTAWDLRAVALITREPTDVSLEAGPILLLVALSLVALVLRRPLPAWAALLLAGVPLVLGAAGLLFYLDLPGASADLGIGLVATLLGAVVMLAGLALSPRMLPRPLIRLR